MTESSSSRAVIGSTPFPAVVEATIIHLRELDSWTAGCERPDVPVPSSASLTVFGAEQMLEAFGFKEGATFRDIGVEVVFERVPPSAQLRRWRREEWSAHDAGDDSLPPRTPASPTAAIRTSVGAACKPAGHARAARSP
jgi:hypothetical protein